MDILPFDKNEARCSWADEDETLALQLLRSDPLYYRIPEDKRSEIIEIALSAGVNCAVQLSEQYSCEDPLRIARLLEIRVLFDISRRNPEISKLVDRLEDKR